MSEKQPTLEVQAFGKFSVKYGDKFITKGKGKATKTLRLFQILLCNHKNGISRGKLLEILYGEENLEDAANNLRVTAFRLKKMLVNEGLPPYEYIQISQGMYLWRSPMPVEVDAEQFMTCCTLAENCEKDEEKIELLRKACTLYGGEYLQDFSGNGMILAESVWYKDRYTEALSTLCEMLMEGSEYQEIYEICEPACKMYPFDEWQALQIECLMKMERYKEALKEYEDTAKLFIEELGIAPSGKMLDLFDQMNSRMNFKAQMLPEIEKHLKEEKLTGGVYYCSFPSFRDAYRLMSRLMERNGQPIFLMLCSITDGKGRPIEHSQKLEVLGKELQNTIEHCLRKGDSYTKYSKSQFLLLLVGAKRENCDHIFERIRKYYSREHRNWGKYLEYNVVENEEMEQLKMII